jgi:plasmid stabilization system protein ParE
MTAHRIELLPAAQIDITEITDYLLTQSIQAANAFLNDIENDCVLHETCRRHGNKNLACRSRRKSWYQ